MKTKMLGLLLAGVAMTGAVCGQSLIISEIVDATESGGLPKFVELTNVGETPVNLSSFGIANFNNGATSSSYASYTLPDVDLAAGDSYVLSYESGDVPGTNTFLDVYGFEPDNYDQSSFFNGDDVIILFNTNGYPGGNAAVVQDDIVDVFGVLGTDGSGEPWEYMDSYAYRNSAITAPNSTFTLSEWTFGGANILDGVGAAGIAAATDPGAHLFEAATASSIALVPAGTIELAEGAEIVAFDENTATAFVTTPADGLAIIDLSDPTAPLHIGSLLTNELINSVAVHDGLVAVAVESGSSAPGAVVFLDAATGAETNRVVVGILPDNVVFSPNGLMALTANEAETGDHADYGAGSISVIDLSAGVASATVTNLGFEAFDSLTNELRAAGVRIFPGCLPSQDFEPEFVAVSPDSTQAFVTLQEANAMAVVDLTVPAITGIAPLGLKDWSLPENTLDAGDKDAGINMTNYPFFGMYMPDTVVSFEVGGATYYVIANEGDSRDYLDVDETRLEDVTLDTNAFPNAAMLQSRDWAGRLKVSLVDADTDGDGDFDVVYAYGGRSFSILDENGTMVYDSADAFETYLATERPQLFNIDDGDPGEFDKRSDDKGCEPEAVEVGVVDGVIYAFIGLERVGGIMVYNVSNPASPEFVQFARLYTDAAPEGMEFVAATNSPSGKPLLLVANEDSNTLTVYGIETDATGLGLQFLHASDLEGSVDAIDNAPNFAAVVEALENDAAGRGIGSVLLSAGDNYIPGPFFSASGDYSMRSVFQSSYSNFFDVAGLDNVREGGGRADITIMNLIGFDASCFGNHEFDAGTSAAAEIIGQDLRGGTLNDVRWPGAQFPYLSANLDFSADASLGGLFTDSLLESAAFASTSSTLTNAVPKIAPLTIINVGGERVGVVGGTTPILASISSPGDVAVKDPGAGSNDMADLAEILQPQIDRLTVAGVNKIVLVTHLQQLALETELLPLLSGVDIAVAGGSDTLLADGDDYLRAGDVADDTYPRTAVTKDGEPALIVSTDGEYSYVGRLVVDFTVDGQIVTTNLDSTVNGAYATDDQGVSNLWGSVAAAYYADGKADRVKEITDGVEGVVIAKDSNVFGHTSVFIEGRREFVRTEETTLGDLSADANLWMAQLADPTVAVSIKNGGGIRAEIGAIDGYTGELLPPQANALSGKLEGQISQLDIENSLRFNNGLTLMNLTATQLWYVVEHAVAATADGATPGQFGQFAGIAFTFDPSAPAYSRVQSLALTDASGSATNAIVAAGQMVGDPQRPIRIVTLDFLVNFGGDNYPFDDYEAADAFFVDRVDLADAGLAAGTATFTAPGGEQDALAEYLAAFYPTNGTAYAMAETPIEEDTRIIYLTSQADTMFAATGGSIGVDAATGERQLGWAGMSGVEYQVLFATNLNQEVWTPVGSAAAIDGTIVLDDATDRGEAGFYRIQIAE
ncbi:Trifunctional nucleotide phosphoesterase protein YfkN [Pontiella desulfatans]|uniref:Trifunctional nucleotide phosphoesterase protein YfkN n=1 Tax=Pontiella desulfatans TaxID=2750659 RepID=A0A6C2U0Y3_PONDE|nr:choice-of-anchor I family protein [Pontiella desulfatans]VGO13251.1 Trifunctional nucleotide phosphoesterase protein YfkN [Pontiella desulfatans]